MIKRSLIGHGQYVYGLALPNGDLATGSADRSIKIWNPNNGSLKSTLFDHSNVVFGLTVLPNDQIASESFDKTIKIWDIKTYSLIQTLVGHTGVVYNVLVLPNGDLASSSGDSTIHIWNLNYGSVTRTLKRLKVYFEWSYRIHHLICCSFKWQLNELFILLLQY